MVEDDMLLRHFEILCKSEEGSISAIVQILQAFKSQMNICAKFNQNPELIRTLLADTRKDSIKLLFEGLWAICSMTWIDKLLADAADFRTEGIEEKNFDKTATVTSTVCIYNPSDRQFELKFVKQYFRKNAIVTSGTDVINIKKVQACDPVRLISGSDSGYIPAIIAEYLTNERIEKERMEMINFSLTFVMPQMVGGGITKAANAGQKISTAAKIISKVLKLTEEARILLMKWADDAVKLFSKRTRPGVVCVLEGKGKQFLAYSNKTKLGLGEVPEALHPLVKSWLKNEGKIFSSNPTYGKCGEPAAISEWLWKVDPKGKMSINEARSEFTDVICSARKIKGSSFRPAEHGHFIEACETCNPLLKHFNIIQVF